MRLPPSDSSQLPVPTEVLAKWRHWSDTAGAGAQLDSTDSKSNKSEHQS